MRHLVPFMIALVACGAPSGAGAPAAPLATAVETAATDEIVMDVRDLI